MKRRDAHCPATPAATAKTVKRMVEVNCMSDDIVIVEKVRWSAEDEGDARRETGIYTFRETLDPSKITIL